MKIVLVSAVALIDRDMRILISRRPQTKQMAGFWEFPGGKIEKDETPETALIRELSEELGINTWQSCLAPLCFASHGYSDFHLVMMLFACRKWRGVARALEGQTLKWVKVQDLNDLTLLPADKPLIPILRDWLGNAG